MAVSYGDIRRWEPEDAGRLADAMQALIGELGEIEEGLRDGKAWTDWRDSAGADGAEGRITGIGDYVTDRAAEAERVRDIAADVERSLDPVKFELDSVELLASTWGFRITDGGQVVDSGAPVCYDEVAREAARTNIVQTVDEIVRAGREIESTAATGLTAVNNDEISDDGAQTVAGATDAARTRHGIGAIPGEDASATEVNVWWNSLEESQREEMMTSQRELWRNRAGVPSAARNEMNRAKLDEDLAALRREKESIGNSTDDSHFHNGIVGGVDPKSVERGMLQGRIDELEKLRRTLDGKDTFLLEYDTSKKRVEAAVAHGNPDEAKYVSITTPGLSSSVDSSVGGMSGEARELRDKAARMAGVDKSEVSTIAYIGYQAPQGVDVVSTNKAKAGGRELAEFTEGIAATNRQADLNLNLFGHSYGSTTTGIAAQFLNDDGITPVDNMALYGSPGFSVVDESGNQVFEPSGNPRVPSQPAQPDLQRDLGLDADNAYYMKYNRDFVSMTGALGNSPGNWGMTRLDVATMPSSMPGAGTNGVPSHVYDVDDYNDIHDSDVGAHSAFPKNGTTSQENLAAILGGRPDLVHHQQ